MGNVAQMDEEANALTRAKTIAAGAIIIVIVLIVVAGAMAFNRSPDLLNSEFRVIITDSMDGEPTDYEIRTIPKDSLIAVHKVSGTDVQDIEVGDVIGFRSAIVGGNNIYHRVISVNEDQRTFTTKGDNASSSETVSFDNVTGKVANVSHSLGQAISFVKHNTLLVLFAFLMLAIMAYAFSFLLRTWKG